MTDSDPTRHPRGQRTLAAILFTDVVGFSARVQEDEEHTLELVRRDLEFMTARCADAGLRKHVWIGGAVFLVVATIAAVLVWIAVRHSGEPVPRPHVPSPPATRPATAAATKATIEIAALPATEAEFDRLYGKLGKTPEGAAAAFVAAAAMLETEPQQARKCMLRVLGAQYRDAADGPTSRLRFFVDRLLRQPRIARSYFVGTTAANSYQLPPPPLRIAFQRNPGSQVAPDRVKLFVVSTGGGSARPIELRRTSDGLWRVEEMSSVALGVRGP